mmetsp:Transcript_17559/g.42215  ORF Transcript_17559/g.42215 Transcript_17559/m.42215 type:complete len:314 (+) Transcript_17559:31-972(+)
MGDKTSKLADNESNAGDAAPADAGQYEDSFMIAEGQLEWGDMFAEGTTAHVYLGRLRGRQVAIKKINIDQNQLKGVIQHALKSFDREAMVWPHVQHPNVVQLLGVQTRPLLLVSEYCAGGSLFDLLHNNRALDLSWLQRTKMLLDVACAMNYLHTFEPQIIHRDLKSLNILLVEALHSSRDVPDVKISDFGFARIKTTKQWGMMTKDAGTFHWMAPEVVDGHYSEMVDVFSYAMIMYEALCRRIPFQELPPSVAVLKTVRGERPPLDAVSPGCPEMLTDLMQQCWNKDPKDRAQFARIVGLLQALQYKLGLED